MKDIEIAMTGPMMRLVSDGLEQHFTVHRPADAPDQEAFFQTFGPRIRGLATGSHATVDAAYMDRLPRLEIIANYGVGYDTVDAAEAGRRGIVVTNTPDVLTVGTVTSLVRADVFQWGSLMAGALLAAAPPLIIYAFLMDYYISGLTAGATKG